MFWKSLVGRGRQAFALSLLLTLTIHNVVLAQQESTLPSGPSAEAASPAQAVTGLPDKIQEKWAQAHAYVLNNDVRSANTALIELNELRKDGGLANLEDASLFLVSRGLVKLDFGRTVDLQI